MSPNSQGNVETKEDQNDFKSRRYQDEILKACIEKNTIVYLPTGAGKTYIALMALKHFAKDLEKPIAQGGKRSIFLTNTQALAHQQAEVISQTTPLKVAVYTGDMNVDAWNKEKWFKEFDENQVITATVQIVLDVIRHGFLSISNFNLIVFDECHNAQKEHPMLMLMALFSRIPENQHPRVIGLTGMLTAPSVKPMNVIESLQRLEGTFRATITTAHGDSYNDVLLYSTAPKESTITFESNPIMSASDDLLKIERTIDIIKGWPLDETHEALSDRNCSKQPKAHTKYKTILSDLLYNYNNFGLYGGILSNMAALVDVELKKREANTSAAKWLARTMITGLEEVLHTNIDKVYDMEDIDDMDIDGEIDEEKISDNPTTILTNSSNQIQRLLIFLKHFAESRQNATAPMKGLIFVQRRYTARILCHIIRRYVNAYPNININVDFMTGRNAFMPDSIETLMTNKNNSAVLSKFKRNEINLIVTTSVLEEGIDLQECNLVICYDAPTTFRSYVQTKGRARMKNSHYVIMKPAASINKLQAQVAEWKEINDILKKYLVEKAVDRPPPLQEDIDKAVELRYNEVFKTPKGAAVDYFSAISLVNRYCTSLPRDEFTDPVPIWEQETDNAGRFTVKIMLPIQSPLKSVIVGKPMPSLRIAKRSASFEAIKQLYELNQFTDNLLPISSKKCLDKYSDLYFKTWKDPRFREDNKKKDAREVGTKKCYRMHEITTPNELLDSMPQVDVQCFLYELKIQPNFKVFENDEHEESLKIFHKLLQSNRSYGILTTKQLPKMGLMKFFQSFGQIDCAIDEKPITITIGNTEKMNELKRFHCILFRNVLDIWKTFFVYDHKDSIIIVPTKNHNIDWHIVDNFQTWSEFKKKTIAERMSAEYHQDEWLYTVVCPWYRADIDARYVVTQVSMHKTPFSSFPNDEFESYADYAVNKYPDIDRVVKSEQFLIGVKPLTTRLNRLHSGEGEDGRRNARPKTRSAEYFIPELCHNFRYPGDLWIKAIILPSALHRITYILHADHIRREINKYVGLQIRNYQPHPLIDVMAKKKESSAKIGSIQNSILYPRPDDCDAKEITVNDIARFDEDRERLGPEIQEPIDLERHFDSVYEVDIDYYFQYMNRQMMNLSLDPRRCNDVFANSILSPNRFQVNIPALCDVEEVDKLRISLLNVKLSTKLSRGVEQHELLAAITSASSADVFHNEILEVLGDAFLKFGVSLYLIQQHTDWHEGYLTAIKGRIVGNRNLCYSAIRHGLPGMIKVHNFNPKDDWQPPMFKVDDRIRMLMKELNIKPDLLFKLEVHGDEHEKGELNNETCADYVQKFSQDSNVGGDDSSMQNFLGMQRISDKTCADSVEAILGTCVKTIGIERTFKVLEMFEILPRNHNVSIAHMLGNKLRSPRIRTNIRDHEVDDFLANRQKLETSIGYTFKDRAYLLQALTHPSYPTNRVTGCYQQLEFLGDAVLDFLITAYISERCPNMDPGQLTDLRSALVNNVTLACLCVRFNIHTHILSQNAMLTESINRFVEFQRKHNHQVTDHVELLMEEKDVQCKMAEYTDVPKTLGDVFEAIIGGIFLDSGNDLELTWKVIYRLMKTELDKFMANVPIQLVRQLYEHPNANPEFDEPQVNKDLDRVFVDLRFTCNGEILLVHGVGTNKNNAKRAAAKLALSKLKLS